MTGKRRNSLGILIVLIIILVACILFLFMGDFIIRIPGQALELYGPPSQGLSLVQHYQLSFRLTSQHELLNTPRMGFGEDVFFTVEMGESISSILDNLAFMGLVADQEALRDYLIYTGLDTQLQAGRFLLSPTMTPIEIVTVMMDPSPQVIEFNILRGWRLEEIAANLLTSGLAISPEEFIQAANTRPLEISFMDQIPLGVSLEGFLPPGSYMVNRDINCSELILNFLRAFEDQLSLELLEAFTRQGLTLYQAVTLASLVERESIFDEEQPMIASVFLNRIAIDMYLESDPTVQYALGFNEAQHTWWTNPISLDQLQVDSPYNTYRNGGLMPTPISNPSMSSLQAVAYPAQTDYYFFRATCDNSGHHNFSRTFEEHVNYGCP